MRADSRHKVCLLKPTSKFKAFWSLIIVVLLVYTAIFVPFKIAFIEQDPFALVILEATVDCLFGLDIFINFISAQEDPNTNQLITDHRIIAKNYLKGWFLLDLLACFPFQLIPLGGGEGEDADSVA